VDHPNPLPPDEPGEPGWTLPLHGAEVPGEETAGPNEAAYLPPDEDVPASDFQPRLSRFGEAA
jgi:hypothetical protein